MGEGGAAVANEGKENVGKENDPSSASGSAGPPGAKAGGGKEKARKGGRTRTARTKRAADTDGESGGGHEGHEGHVGQAAKEATAGTALDVKSLKVAQLRAELRSRGMDASGLKKDLQARLQGRIRQEEKNQSSLKPLRLDPRHIFNPDKYQLELAN